MCVCVGHAEIIVVLLCSFFFCFFVAVFCVLITSLGCIIIIISSNLKLDGVPRTQTSRGTYYSLTIIIKRLNKIEENKKFRCI